MKKPTVIGSLLRGAAIAFSIYSRIPVPQVRWDNAYMKHAFCFFPLIGVVIGGVETAWYFVALELSASVWLFAAVAAMLPVLLTGGIHLDGLMDTCDALASHAEPKIRSAILIDPHVGAFAVIHCCLYFLLSAGIYAQVYESGSWREIVLLGIGYVVARSVCALCVITLPCARESGLARTFQNGADNTTVLITQIVFLLVAGGLAVWLSPSSAATSTVLIMVLYIRFLRVTVKKFTGITGDLAGFLLTRIELTMGVAVVGVLLLKGVTG